MSDPQNPLNYFRNYSYHHIMIACDGTKTAEALVDAEISRFDRRSDYDESVDWLCPQAIGDGRYIVMINGLTDVRYTIKSAKWSNVLIPNEGTNEGTTHFRTMATDGEIEIAEPMGVRFLNDMNKVTKALGTDANGVCFVLKTIFVGHRDDGTEEWINDIRPLLFFVYDISALFDVTGAEYIMSFVGIVNGAARLPHVSSVGDGFTFEIPSTNLLDAMNKLTTEINNYYGQQKEALIKAAKCADTSFDYAKEYVDVEYEIDLHPDYNDFPTGTANPPNQSTTGGNESTVTMKGDTISIEGLIDIVMKSSDKVLKEGNPENEERFMFKVTSTLDTSPTKYKVVYQIQRFKAAVIPTEEFYDFGPDPDGEGGITFDYIFTGKNVDIKSFDIKMQFGMTFFQTLSAASSVQNGSDAILSHANDQPKVAGSGNKELASDQEAEYGDGCDTVPDTERKKPLFLGQSIKDSSLRNKRLPGPAVSYNTLLARHTFIEGLDARMVIHGNPQMLAETTLLPNDVRTKNEDDSANTEPNCGVLRVSNDTNPRNVFPAVQRVPGFVKVNVFMPNSAMVDDSNAYTRHDYSANFWYPGWYFVYSINNVFADGEFTQELEMFSLPLEATQSKIDGDPEKKCGEDEKAQGESKDTVGTGEPAPDPAPYKQTVRGKRRVRGQGARRNQESTGTTPSKTPRQRIGRRRRSRSNAGG